MKNDVQEIVLIIEKKSSVTSKWIYKIKHSANGSIKKYKARFVARGFSQKEGINYKETFAPIARYTSIRCICASILCEIHQLDINTTFLNDVIEEEVYVKQSLGVETHDRKTHVYKYKKALYKLKRHPWDSTYSYMRILNIN